MSIETENWSGCTMDPAPICEFRRHDRHVLARRAVRHRLGAMTHEEVISIPGDETAVVVRVGARDARAGLGDLDFCAMIGTDGQPIG